MFDIVDLVGFCQKAAGAEVSFASDDELLAGVKALAAARAAFDAAELHVLGELDRRGVCDRDFGSTTATWVAHETRADRRVVAGRVQVAAKLHHPLGEVGEALGAGRISFEHARALAVGANPRVADLVAAEQADWITRAGDRPFVVWRAELAARVELLDQDGPFDSNRDLARNRLASSPPAPTPSRCAANSSANTR